MTDRSIFATVVGSGGQCRQLVHHVHAVAALADHALDFPGPALDASRAVQKSRLVLGVSKILFVRGRRPHLLAHEPGGIIPGTTPCQCPVAIMRPISRQLHAVRSRIPHGMFMQLLPG